MGIPVKLEAFEGPLDLLLHLIEKNKVNIYDIPIVEITDQYMEYIRQLPIGGACDVIERISCHGSHAPRHQVQGCCFRRRSTEEGEELDPREELSCRSCWSIKCTNICRYELRDRQEEAESRCFYKPADHSG